MALTPLKIKSESNGFTFTVNAKSLVEKIQRILEVTGYSSKSDVGRFHLIVSDGKNVYVVGYSDETHGVLLLPDVAVKNKGAFILSEPDVFIKLMKTRAEMAFSYSGGSLNYKATKGKFTGDVNTAKIASDQVIRVNSMFKGVDGGSKLSPDLMSKIREGVRRTRISDIYQNKIVLSCIKFEKNVLTVSTADELHLAHYEAKLKVKDKPFKLALPAQLFTTVDKFTGDEEANFSMTGKGFAVYGDDYLIGFPPLQADDSLYSKVPIYIQALDKPVCTFETGAKLIETQKSISSLAQLGSRYLFNILKKGVVKMSLKTDSGSGTDSFKVSNMKMKMDKLEIRIDPIIFEDLVALADKELIPMALYTRNKGIEVKMYTITSKPSKNASLILMGSVSQ